MAKALGTIKSIQADSIIVAAEAGGELTATISPSTKVLRVPPGEKDLKNAVPLQAQDLQVGDRVLVRGKQSADAKSKSMSALSVIVMKQTDVAAQQDQQRADWQKRGVGGLVTAVDAAKKTITISSSGIGAKRSITVHIADDTILRRYAPGSVRFDDAKVMNAGLFMTEAKAGDQLRARGTRSADGDEISAHEIVAGSFRNIAGTVQTVDAANNTITVWDAISKTAVVVTVSSDSQIKKLPPEMAQRIAARLKAPGAGADSSAPSDATRPGPPQRDPASERNAVATSNNLGPASETGSAGNGPPDLQRMLSRLPTSTISDLKSGDAVMMVATEDEGANKATAITLLAGVEPILTAAPNRSASSLLSPWSLSAPSGESESTQ